MGDHSKLLPAEAISVAHAGEVIRRGGLVAFPTETVYGLGADATNDKAVAAVFAAKGRPRFNPLIVHVPAMDAAAEFAVVSPVALRLAERFWPGPLTLVLPRKPECAISLLASAGLDTIAVRVPAHPVAQQLLRAAGVPIAAPSANRSGHVSPTEAHHVVDDLHDQVDLILDGGRTPRGIESTVIGVIDRLVMLRHGAIPRKEIERVGGSVDKPSGDRITSPGQLASHYAPRTALRLDADDVQAGEALLAFGAQIPLGVGIVSNLSASGDVNEAAANLFAMLRELDRAGARRIAVMPVPQDGLGEAINDRLRRAAAPRETP